MVNETTKPDKRTTKSTAHTSGAGKKLEITLQHYQRLEAGTSEGSVKVWSRLKEILNAPSIDHLLEQEDTLSITEKTA